MIPTIIEKSNNKEYAYDLYSRLLKDRIIFLTGEINNTISSIIVSELLYLDSINHDDISLYINSPGGEITSGLAIYDTMNFIKSDVKTICVGLCASMGAFLLSSGKKGKRYSLKNSEIMIHQPLGGAEGKATDIQIAADHIMKTKDKMNKILAKNTNQALKKILKDTEADYYMNAKEAKEYGLIDELI
ncbi:MAG: ATP-dependent Clp protease proteolytic subunit [Firmicutes bacterium]|nr:ATP-dependent Clp protease proteolytic subunit [Bacillota bacterium]